MDTGEPQMQDRWKTWRLGTQEGDQGMKTSNGELAHENLRGTMGNEGQRFTRKVLDWQSARPRKRFAIPQKQGISHTNKEDCESREPTHKST